LLLCLAGLPLAAGAAPETLLRTMLAANCAEPAPSLARLAAALPGSKILEDKPRLARGAVIGWYGRLAPPAGGELRLERIAPGGRLRRLLVEYWGPAPDGGTRPELALIADSGCAIQQGRRLVYEADSPDATAIEHLDSQLSRSGPPEPLNPPVPPGADPGGPAVAIVDSGVNYLLPEIGSRLARDASGGILGFDYWDLDRRPFDANPARSPFFPQHHGTRTASLLLREAPGVRLVVYRYPRPDMARMTELVRAAADAGVVVVNLSMGSNRREAWQAFESAARQHPQMLFIVSAGNDGRDIDAQPVYPAALPLANLITVTSAEPTGELAVGSNWGKQSVDLLVPAERLAVTGFDGGTELVSGSSYAAVRVSALAARLLGDHPRWRAAELKTAIFVRALPAMAGEPVVVAKGLLPRPDRADREDPAANQQPLREVARFSIEASELYGREAASFGGGYILRPTFAYFEATAWNRSRLRRYAREAASILARCAIFIPVIDVRVLNGPERLRYFRDANASQIVRSLALPKPTIYFVRDTLQAPAFEAEAIGKGNSASRPLLRDTIWVVEDIRDPGIALAHELVHVLMDSGDHEERTGNLMRADTSAGHTALTPEQCNAIAQAGTRNRLLVPNPDETAR
jgi:hypothetical protein